MPPPKSCFTDNYFFAEAAKNGVKNEISVVNFIAWLVYRVYHQIEYVLKYEIL